MTGEEQFWEISCPHCGWNRKVPKVLPEDKGTSGAMTGPGSEYWGDVIVGSGDEIKITKRAGISEVYKQIAERIVELLADPELDEANAWMDVHKCPNCQHTYSYNVLTGEVRK